MKKEFIFLLALIVLFTFGVTVFVQAQIVLTNPLQGINNFEQLFTKISEGIALLVGSLSAIMLIVAGGMFLLSAGNPTQVGNAKKALTYAIIGIVVSLLAGSLILIIKEIIGAKP